MSEALACAVRLLARREHSMVELEEKLSGRGYEDKAIQEALERCQSQGYLSDQRFAESVCRTRVAQGYGPQRIRHELVAKGVSREIIDGVLALESSQWVSHAQRVWDKKFSAIDDPSFSQKQKQKQFLLYRGFSVETITEIIS